MICNQDAAVKQFMMAMGSAYGIDFRTDQDYQYLARVARLQLDLITEEFEEVHAALLWITQKVEQGMNPTMVDLIDLADGIADLKYVLSHAAVALSIDSDRAFEIVHKSNMTKVGPDGKVIRDPRNGKVLKPDTFEPPHLQECIGC